MNKLTINSLLLASLVFSQQSLADEDIQAGSNIKNFSYPGHNCKSKPVRPEKPKKFSMHDDVEKYNSEIAKYNINVSDYNSAIKKYKACINQYIKNGNNDIKTIRNKLNSALKEVRNK